jgi:hypothetical protein
METPTRTTEQGGPNRRDVLRRGAILGGALVWTTPIVQTLAGPAFAAGTACVEPVEVNTGPPFNQCFIITFTTTPDCCACIAENSPTQGSDLAAAFYCSSDAGSNRCTFDTGPC